MGMSEKSIVRNAGQSALGVIQGAWKPLKGACGPPSPPAGLAAQPHESKKLNQTANTEL